MKKRYMLAFGVIAVLVIVGVLFIPIATRYTVIVQESLAITEIVGNVYAYLNNVLIFNAHNNMTNVGDDAINARLFNASWTGATWTYIAIGTGTGSKASTTLQTEVDRQNATAYKPADAQWGLNYTFTFAVTRVVTEAGILNAAASGTLAFYIWTLSVTCTSVDTLKICWKGTTTGN